MLFPFLFIVALAVIAYGLELVLEQPGSVHLAWGDWSYDASLPVAIGGVLLTIAGVIIVYALLATVLRMPGRFRAGSLGRRRERGFSAITRGMIAVGAGDAGEASRASAEAHRRAPNEPLARYLKAQAAQLSGDRRKAEEAFQEMTLEPQTRVLGLRGLHIEAQRRKDAEAAHHFAREAHAVAPLPWAGGALLEHHAASGDFEKARVAVEDSFKSKAIDTATAQRLRAVVETALAMEKETEHPHEALHLARQALKRRPAFVPAAAVAARTLTRYGDRKRALKLIESVWPQSPHPDLAVAYLTAAPPDSSAQLAAAQRLASLAPAAPESRMLVAQTALGARDFAKARAALAPLIAEGEQPTARVCVLMAEIEDAEHGPSGPVREWLARASRAPRDPAWVADGVPSSRWSPISPRTGRLDAFEWKTPPGTHHGPIEDGRAAIPAAFLTPPKSAEAEGPAVDPEP